MTKKTIAFIGGGHITRIYLEGWKRQDMLPTHISVSDSNAATLNELKARFPGITAAGNSRAAAACDIVVLAVPPPVRTEVAAGIKAMLGAKTRPIWR